MVLICMCVYEYIPLTFSCLFSESDKAVSRGWENKCFSYCGSRGIINFRTGARDLSTFVRTFVSVALLEYELVASRVLRYDGLESRMLLLMTFAVIFFTSRSTCKKVT